MIIGPQAIRFLRNQQAIHQHNFFEIMNSNKPFDVYV